MDLHFNPTLALQYKSPSQKIRVLTEDWVRSQIFCPSCGKDIDKFEDNRPVADFYCQKCREEFELKSQQKTTAKKIVDGAYKAMIARLQSSQNPSLFLLNYNLQNFEVLNFFVIPKHFFIPNIIEKRKPLSPSARRAGWVGCNILLHDIPTQGRIFFIQNRIIKRKNEVLNNWQKTLFLREAMKLEAKGWILDIMNCIDKLNKKEFLLGELYGFEQELKLKHPNNRHIKDKIRQQLQFLRDKGYLEFLGQGKYRLV